MTAIEWLVETFKLTNVDLSHHKLLIEQAKEMEKQKQDEFAIGFAEWCFKKYNIISCYDMEELLKIYKKEKGL